MNPSGNQGARVFRRLQELVGSTLANQFRPLLGDNPTPEKVAAVVRAIDILRPGSINRAKRFDPDDEDQIRQFPERPEWLRKQTLAKDGPAKLRAKDYVFGIDPSEPIYRGKMQEVDSSNVHSIGFLWNDREPANGRLLVRFWHKESGKQKTPGATYVYERVHPNVFELFRDAASKGKWVWDRLRIRGTVSGHQYDYRLFSISNNYVPRQATRIGNQEWFVPRKIRVERPSKFGEFKEITSLTSALPRELVRTLPGGDRRVPLVQRGRG